MSQIQEVQRKVDGHLVVATLAIILTILGSVFTTYVSISTRLTRIETVLIMKGDLPKEFACDPRKGEI